jgi:hypothetical protein
MWWKQWTQQLFPSDVELFIPSLFHLKSICSLKIWRSPGKWKVIIFDWSYCTITFFYLTILILVEQLITEDL